MTVRRACRRRGRSANKLLLLRRHGRLTLITYFSRNRQLWSREFTHRCARSQIKCIMGHKCQASAH
uniref:Uncharacterized protein n=1 Tax=Arundo donax TaxID=35708 RepID=A0A0A8ZIB5_ARUDO